jgi:hypothetical protein
MPEIYEFEQPLLWHELTQAGPIPTVHDPDGVYPYPSFAETARRPALRRFRFIALENQFVRATVCPDLGGKIYSLQEKRSGHEVLFKPTSIHAVRILPRMGFIPGGIEVSFPISHSPVQLAPVHFQCQSTRERTWVACGERELHAGMQWTVEYSLGSTDRFLTQRTCFRNPGERAHAWMSWSNAALPARPDTEFHFPAGPVLRHDNQIRTIDWVTAGPRRVADVSRMTGYFWQQPDVCAFGAFTPSLGHGLYHFADATSAPGMKLWTYGLGRDERWARAASASGEMYVEIQGGPIRDQSIKYALQPGERRCHIEYWLPSDAPLDLASLSAPARDPGLVGDVPWFDWPSVPETGFWRAVAAAWLNRNAAELPQPPALDQNNWAPRGQDNVGDALRWAADATSSGTRAGWQLQLGAWLAARGQLDDALELLARTPEDRARALAGRLYRTATANTSAAVRQFEQIKSDAVALHPQVVIERDLALAALGQAGLTARESWLDGVGNLDDEWLRERRAALLLDQGKPAEALAVLLAAPFQLVHQRYARTELWQRIKRAQNQPADAPPASLGEDDLARFGAYREFADSGS